MNESIEFGTSSAIESGQSIMADHAPHTARRPYKRGESKADIAVARHELMQENIRLQNELAAAKKLAFADRKVQDAEIFRLASLVVDLRARCRLCPAKWWRAKA